jgi:mRNA-degrading endonuclease RelE of RelBE toxin-antitoxin system
MYTITYERSAEAWLLKLAKRNPDIVAKIVKKIDWLAQNVDHLDHEKMKGHPEMSLHFAGYRILYIIDRLQQVIIVRFIDKHDDAYQKLKRT